MWFTSFYSPLIVGLMNFEATCEHDKIYAALGLAESILGPGPPGPALQFSPDYTKPWTDVYVSFTTAILSELPSIQLIAGAEKRKGDGQVQGLPSWCPDFRFRRSSFPMTHIEPLGLSCRCWMASGSIEGPMTIDEGVLSISGKFIDAALEMSPPVETMVDFAILESTLQPCFEIASRLDQPDALTGQDRVEVLWRTLMTDYYCDTALGSETHPAPPTFADAFVSVMKCQLAFNCFWAKRPGADPSEYEEFLKILEQREASFGMAGLPSRPSVLDFAERVGKQPPDADIVAETMVADTFVVGSMSGAARFGNGRCLFRTRQHNLLGFPAGMEAGDEIFLLKRAFTPFILRPKPNGQYQLVGEVYVHGMMKGEWLDCPGGADGFRPVEIA